MKDKIYLLKYAIDYLSKFDSSKKNLERILKQKIIRITNDKKERFQLYSSMDYVFENLEKNNLINDENYAQNKIRLLVSQGKSKNYINQFLFQKGLSKSLINNKLIDFENENSNWEKEAALVFARKKRIFEKNEEYEKKLAKMARAGFSYELCKEILNKN